MTSIGGDVIAMTGDVRELPEEPAHLFWLDLETTGLLPQDDYVLEVAWVLTSFRYPYLESRRGHHLMDVSISDARARMDPYVTNMHTKNGLLSSLEERQMNPDGHGTLYSIAGIEGILMNLSDDWPTDKKRKVYIAGHSAHFDLGFLRVKMPLFIKRLSHRVFDASAISAHCRSMGMPRVPRKEAHRAREDVMEAIEHVRACTQWLLSLDPIVKAGL